MWIANFLVYDYEITYKNGLDNQADDALSRIHGPELLAMEFSTISIDLLDQVNTSWEADPDYRNMLDKLMQGTHRVGSH